MQEGPRRADRGAAPGGRRRHRPAGGGRPLRDAVAVACERWGAEIEGWADAAYSAVAYVRLPDGRPAVAKRSPDTIESRHDGDALAVWAGHGAVRLLGRADDRVLLLERAVPGHPAEADEVLGAALRRLWVAPPAGVAWRRFADAVVGWRACLARWRGSLGDVAVDSALAASDGDLDAGSWRLLHGDGHHGNVVWAGEGRGWLAIDPAPLIGPPGYDLANALWNGPDGEVEVEPRLAVLASSAGVAPASLRRWARFRSALSVAWDLDDGVPLGRRSERALAVARELATTVPGP